MRRGKVGAYFPGRRRNTDDISLWHYIPMGVKRRKRNGADVKAIQKKRVLNARLYNGGGRYYNQTGYIKYAKTAKGNMTR